MRFRVLGRLEIHTDAGEPVPVNARHPRRVLAMLLLSANEAVPVDRLIDAVWDDDPPPSARKNIQTYVWSLRKALGSAGEPDRLIARSPGYLIGVEPGELDLAEFRALVARGQALCGRDPEAASGCLRSALQAWRGPALVDVVEPGTVLAAAAARLDEARLVAWELCVEAELAAGRHLEIVTELGDLVAAHPWRERLAAARMVALFRCGRQAEALGAYQELRTAMIEQLGIEPGPTLTRLHQRMLAADPALLQHDAPGARSGATRGDDTGRSAPGPAQVPRQLPGAVPLFTGRVRELARLDSAARRPGTRIVVIDGTAGIGKSTAAIFWAHRNSVEFPDGQLYVNLRGFDPSADPTPPADVLRDFLTALGVDPRRVPDDLSARACLYRSVVSGRRLMVLLDNARDAAQVRPLLPGDPACLVVVTSRCRLTSLVATDGAAVVSLDLLHPGEAKDLLAARLHRDWLERDGRATDELVDLCAGLPLALSIVAARAATSPHLTVAHLVATMRDCAARLDTLHGGDASADIRTAFSWSYHQLERSTARMFRLLSVHPGPDLSLPAAASILGVPARQARAALQALVDGCLLVEPAPDRYTFHDLLRIYATEQARAQETVQAREAATQRMLDHYLHTAAAATATAHTRRSASVLRPACAGATTLQFAGRAEALDWLQTERTNLHAVVRLAADAGFTYQARQIPWTLIGFLERYGYWEDWVDSQRIALAAARVEGDRPAIALACRCLGRALLNSGQVGEARRHLDEALRLCEQLDDPTGQARVHQGLAMVCEAEHRPADALRHATDALNLYRRVDDRPGQANALNAVGWCSMLLGRYQEALAACEEALGLHRQLGYHSGEAATWDSIGQIHERRGDHGQAVACHQRALSTHRQTATRHRQASSLLRLERCYQLTGQPDAARDARREALAILEELRHAGAAGPRGDNLPATGIRVA
jgi:DNA-binding SARP family transcriptional activator/tetratricopeptide (TPR) repeat protein